MSGIDDPDTPPELPEEYAATYRDAYLRALAEEPEPEPTVVRVPDHGPLQEPDAEDTDEDRSGSSLWLIVLLIAVLLIIGAFVAGKLFSGDSDSNTSAAKTPTTPPSASATHSSGAAAGPTDAATRTTRADAWTGAVQPVTIASATATCTAPPGVDSANKPVSYDVTNSFDADPSTAWRCDGSAIGQSLTFVIPAGTAVGEVGIVPGYAKTDPDSGTDRYAENNRITRVRWVLADGVVVRQRLDPDPNNRALQTIRVPRTVTGTVKLEIRAVRHGSRNTTAISSVEIGEAS